MKSAIILGATGLTGSILLKKLLQDDRYAKIILFSRKTVGFEHPKMEEHLIDLFELEDHQEKFKADEVFCCIGSTQKKTPQKKVYRQVDYGIPVTAAKLCKQNDIVTFVVVSALGANASSKFFYNRIKGEMERDVLKLGIENTYFLRPSLISGERKEKRRFEFFWKQLMKTTDFLMLGPMKKFRSIHPKKIVKTMVYVANHSYGKTIIKSDVIEEIAAHAS